MSGFAGKADIGGNVTEREKERALLPAPSNVAKNIIF
jgi:hypothetical protein